MDFLAVETLVSDLHPRAEHTNYRKVFHGENGWPPLLWQSDNSRGVAADHRLTPAANLPVSA
jgi:hypothetical protein